MGKAIACVTGASGKIGSKIVALLSAEGYNVRVLSRKAYPAAEGVEVFNGDINDESVLKDLIRGSHMLFHCAAELKNESRMPAVNVVGTELVLKYAELYGVKYFCHLSSVGVIGNTDMKLVDESTLCDPQNAYEKSKRAAEQLVLRGIKDCKTVILRPTDVIDEIDQGVLLLPKRSSFIDFCKVLIKGGECAHIVYAEDVARAAIYFISYPINNPECYIVSCDDDPLNTLSGLWALYKAYQAGGPVHSLSPTPHLPIFVPYLFRKMVRGSGNMGDVHYSAAKLLKTGFTFKVGVEEAVRRIVSTSAL